MTYLDLPYSSISDRDLAHQDRTNNPGSTERDSRWKSRALEQAQQITIYFANVYLPLSWQPSTLTSNPLKPRNTGDGKAAV